MNKFVYCAKLKTGEIRFGIIEALDGNDAARRLRLVGLLCDGLDFFGVSKREQHRVLGRACADINPPPLNPSGELSPAFRARMNDAI